MSKCVSVSGPGGKEGLQEQGGFIGAVGCGNGRVGQRGSRGTCGAVVVKGRKGTGLQKQSTQQG